MNKILTSQITDGTFLTQETFLDEKFILLSPEIPVDQALIDHLNRWGFEYLMTAGEITNEPPVSAAPAATSEEAPLAAIDHGRRDAREMAETQKHYEEYLHFTEQLFSNYLQNNLLPIAPIQEKVKNLMELMRDRKRYLLRISELDPGSTNYIVDHAIKTAVIALATATSIKMPPHRLIDLATIALVHEVGMLRLPSQLYMSNRDLTAKEKKAISTHPVLGFKILEQFNYPMQICLGVLEGRENVDGSGYPRGLTTEKISTYAKIINPASTFAAMTSPRPYRPAIDGHTAMKTLLMRQNSYYEKEILQAMVLVLSLFPYGTYVQLASGSRAIVVDVDPDRARAPYVRILTDGNGTPTKKQIITATVGNEHAVTGVLSAEEIERIRHVL